MSIAIANAVLDVIEQEKLRENATAVGNFLLAELNKLKAEHDFIGDVRGRGLFLGVEIVRSKLCKRPDAALAEHIVAAFKQQLVLMSTEGIAGNILKFKPPMCFSMENARTWLDVLRSILATLDDPQTLQAIQCARLAADGQASEKQPAEPKQPGESRGADSALGSSSCSSSANGGSLSSSSCLSEDSLTSLGSSSGDENL